MRRIRAQTFVSIDGVMQAPGGPDEDRDGGFERGGWTFNYWDAAMGEVMGEAMREEYDLLLGRRTYDIFAGFWPTADDPQVTPKFDRATKYVATSDPASLGWQNSVALTGDVPAAVRALKAGEGPMLSLQGSSALLRSLLAAGLVDELALWTFPVLLGRGKRAFPEEMPAQGFELVEQRAFGTGVVQTVWKAGEIRPSGDFTT